MVNQETHNLSRLDPRQMAPGYHRDKPDDRAIIGGFYPPVKTKAEGILAQNVISQLVFGNLKADKEFIVIATRNIDVIKHL